MQRACFPASSHWHAGSSPARNRSPYQAECVRAWPFPRPICPPGASGSRHVASSPQGPSCSPECRQSLTRCPLGSRRSHQCLPSSHAPPSDHFEWKTWRESRSCRRSAVPRSTPSRISWSKCGVCVSERPWASAAPWGCFRCLPMLAQP